MKVDVGKTRSEHSSERLAEGSSTVAHAQLRGQIMTAIEHGQMESYAFK